MTDAQPDDAACDAPSQRSKPWIHVADQDRASLRRALDAWTAPDVGALVAGALAGGPEAPAKPRSERARDADRNLDEDPDTVRIEGRRDGARLLLGLTCGHNHLHVRLVQGGGRGGAYELGHRLMIPMRTGSIALPHQEERIPKAGLGREVVRDFVRRLAADLPFALDMLASAVAGPRRTREQATADVSIVGAVALHFDPALSGRHAVDVHAPTPWEEPSLRLVGPASMDRSTTPFAPGTLSLLSDLPSLHVVEDEYQDDVWTSLSFGRFDARAHRNDAVDAVDLMRRWRAVGGVDRDPHP